MKQISLLKRTIKIKRKYSSENILYKLINDHYETIKKEYISGLIIIDNMLKENLIKFEICCCIDLMILKNENEHNIRMMNKLANSIQQLHNHIKQKCEIFIGTFIFQIPLISLIKECLEKVLEYCDFDDKLINRLKSKCKEEESLLSELSYNIEPTNTILEKKRYRKKIIKRNKKEYLYCYKYYLIKKAFEEKSMKMNKEQVSILSTKEESIDEPHVDFNLKSVIDLDASSIEYNPTNRDYFNGNWFGNFIEDKKDIPLSTGINAKLTLKLPLFTPIEEKKPEPPRQSTIAKKFCDTIEKLNPEVIKTIRISNETESTKVSEADAHIKEIRKIVNKHFYNNNDNLSTYSDFNETEPPITKPIETNKQNDSDILAYKTPPRNEYYCPKPSGPIDKDTARRNLYLLLNQCSNYK